MQPYVRGVGLASLMGLGAVFLHAHQETEVAIGELSAWIAKSPQQPGLRFSRSSYFYDDARYDECEADLTTVDRVDAAYPGLDLAFAKLYLATERPELARSRLDRVLASQPNEPTALILRARIRARTKDLPGAVCDFSAAIAVLPEPRPEHYLERAALVSSPEEALAGLNEGIARIGPAPPLLEGALELELQLGRIEDALARLAESTERSGRKEFWWKRRGDVLAGAGRSEDAQQAYAHARAELNQQPKWLQETPDALRLADDLAKKTGRSFEQRDEKAQSPSPN